MFGSTVCPETIGELICLSSWDVKMMLRHQKWILPQAQVARNYVTEIIQISYKNGGALKWFQDNLCDVITSITLWRSKSIVQN